MAFKYSGVEGNTGSLHYQYLATLTGCLSVVTIGMHFGWPSPSLPILIGKDSPIRMTNDEGSWIASMPCIGSAAGSILAALFVDRIGRKKCLLISSPLHLIAWVMVAFSHSVPMLIGARFLAGSSDGIGFTVFPMYLGEIANSKIRGLLGSSIQVSMTFGMLVINIIGSYLNIKHAALVSAVIPVLHFITFVFMPESPYYLILKKDITEARKSLQKFYACEDVTAEFHEVAEAVRLDQQNSGKFWQLFTVSSNRKAVLIVFGVRAVQQFSGTNAITFYAKTIFQESGGDVSATFASITYFAVQIVVATVASFLVDKFGRKPLLLFSIGGAGAGLLLEGLYFYLRDYIQINMNEVRYIPVVALLFYVIIFNLGMGTIPYLLMGEMFPTTVKAFALCLADISADIIITIVSKCFQIMKDNLGMYVPFFVFAGCCAIGLVFIWLCVPETKGKTLEEIQCFLRGENKIKSENSEFLS